MAKKGGKGRTSGRGRAAAAAGQSQGPAGQRARFSNDDISDDEIDAFHKQRDKVLLGDELDDRQDEDDYDALAPSGRSILNVNEVDSDTDEDDADGDELEDVDDEEEDEVEMLNATRKGSQYSTSNKAGIAPELGDESDDDEDIEAGSDMDDEGDGASGWGPNKRAYYSTNDLDDLESDSEMDEEEKRELELREVRKLQTRSRQGMIDDDFGLADEIASRDISLAAREQRRKDLDADSSAKERLNVPPQPQLAPVELLAQLQRQRPEVLALVGEYADVVDDFEKADARMRELMANHPDHPTLGLIHLHHQTLTTYIAMLTFYFHRQAAGVNVLASTSQRPTEAALVERLAKLKQGLSALEDFGLGVDEGQEDESKENAGALGMDDDEEEEDEEEEKSLRNERINFLFRPPGINDLDSEDDDGGTSLGSLEDDELMQLEADEKENQQISRRSLSSTASEQRTANGKGKAKKGVNAVPTAPTTTKGQSKNPSKVKKQKQRPIVAPLANVEELAEADALADEPQAKRRKQARQGDMRRDAEFDVYGEPTSLGAVDLADKEARRRSLKFHTGQIDARDARPSKLALQGDVDIPYRDKERSRQAVAEANAARVAKAEGRNSYRDVALDADDFGEDDEQAYRDVMGHNDIASVSSHAVQSARSRHEDENDADAGYYDLITRGRKQDRLARKLEHDEARAADRIAPDDAMLVEGEHRGINRQIEKNKGLMASRRPKEVRNPRVKKRKRFEKAQKKLSSRGPVYKGGQASLQGGYGGETSGISSNVVKSRKFN